MNIDTATHILTWYYTFLTDSFFNFLIIPAIAVFTIYLIYYICRGKTNE